MAISNTQRFASIKNSDTVQTSDLTSPGPYVGVVKNNVDYNRSGRLQVYIPLLGSNDPTDQKGWLTCQYLSPFMGFTNMDQPSDQEVYDAVQQSYGFWMVPPDVGIRVLVVFADQDPDKAFWIGCIPEPLKTQMTPAIGARNYSDGTGTPIDFSMAEENVTLPALQESLEKHFTDGGGTTNIRFPSSEIQFKTVEDIKDFYAKARPVHEDVFKQLCLQGTQLDLVRGPITSSSQRESPSQVFGFSTPGRPRKDVAQDANLINKIKSGDIELDEVKDYNRPGKTSRRGGHSVVLDDGNIVGENNLMRLRTARGHQILMHDTEEVIYIQHANGMSWVEMDATGQVTIYASNSVSVRSGQDINLHADRDINLNAGNDIKMRSKKKIKVETDQMYIKTFKETNWETKKDLTVLVGGSIAINSGESGGWNCSGDTNITAATINLNSGPAPQSPKVEDIPKFDYTDVKAQDSIVWKETTEEKDEIESINPIIPTHEPYPRRVRPKTPQQIAEFYRKLL